MCVCTIFKVSPEFAATLFLFCVLARWPWCKCDPSSLTRDQMLTPPPPHWHRWTAWDVPRWFTFSVTGVAHVQVLKLSLAGRCSINEQENLLWWLLGSHPHLDFTSSIFYTLSPPFEAIITIICIIIGVASLNWILPLSQTLQGSRMRSVLPGKLDKWGNRVSEKVKIPWGYPARQWQRWASVLCLSDLKAGDFSMMQALHSKYNPSSGKVLGM